MPPDVRERMRMAHLGVALGELHRNSIGKASKRRWQNLEFKNKTVKAIMQGCQIKPNSPELQLQVTLNKLYPDVWEYTGDGKLIIGGKNPDFWNGDHKLVELYGDYWHAGENSQDRIAHYKQYGYKCLVIWEKELKEQPPMILLERIRGFNNG